MWSRMSRERDSDELEKNPRAVVILMRVVTELEMINKALFHDLWFLLMSFGRDAKTRTSR